MTCNNDDEQVQFLYLNQRQSSSLDTDQDDVPRSTKTRTKKTTMKKTTPEIQKKPGGLTKPAVKPMKRGILKLMQEL